MLPTHHSAFGLRDRLLVVLRTHPRSGGEGTRASVLDCGGPPPLSGAPDHLRAPVESARGLAQSKTSRKQDAARGRTAPPGQHGV